MSSFFISYRREDSRGHAGRLYDDLRAEFGKDKVFIDIDRLDPGINFVERISEVVEAADALIAVIGAQWLGATNAHGQRRLDDPNDFVRLEIATALRRGRRVVPVLVDGAPMPTPQQLPEDLRDLAQRQAVELSDTRWEYDLGRLIDAVGGRSIVTKRRRRRRAAAAGGVLVGIAAVAVGVLAIAGDFLQAGQPATVEGSEVASFDSTVGHREQSQEFVEFLLRYDQEPVDLNTGFQGLSLSDYSAQGFGELQYPSGDGSTIKLYTDCNPSLSNAEERQVELGFTDEVMGNGRCLYTTLLIGQGNDESGVHVTHGQPRVEGYFMVEMGDLQMGETIVRLLPISSQEATERS